MALEVLVGIVASGKSTYARRRADEGALVISYDELAQMLHARYRIDPALRPAYAAIIWNTVAVAQAHGRDVVLDGTHLTRESRRYWVNQARAAGVRVVAIQFPVGPPEDHAARRYATDARGKSYDDWLAVVQRQWAEAVNEPVDAAGEGFDAVVAVRPDESADRGGPGHVRERDCQGAPAAGSTNGVPQPAANSFAVVAPWGTWTT